MLINCLHVSGDFGKVKRVFEIELAEPDVVRDKQGNRIGFWTIVYNQGVAFVLQHRKYFAFSKYKQEGKKVTSYCGSTLPGWSHDILGKNWACYTGRKANPQPPKSYIQPEE